MTRQVNDYCMHENTLIYIMIGFTSDVENLRHLKDVNKKIILLNLIILINSRIIR